LSTPGADDFYLHQLRRKLDPPVGTKQPNEAFWVGVVLFVFFGLPFLPLVVGLFR
jgi:hypothetical protein